METFEMELNVLRKIMQKSWCKATAMVLVS